MVQEDKKKKNQDASDGKQTKDKKEKKQQGTVSETPNGKQTTSKKKKKQQASAGEKPDDKETKEKKEKNDDGTNISGRSSRLDIIETKLDSEREILNLSNHYQMRSTHRSHLDMMRKPLKNLVFFQGLDSEIFS